MIENVRVRPTTPALRSTAATEMKTIKETEQKQQSVRL